MKKKLVLGIVISGISIVPLVGASSSSVLSAPPTHSANDSTNSFRMVPPAVDAEVAAMQRARMQTTPNTYRLLETVIVGKNDELNHLENQRNRLDYQNRILSTSNLQLTEQNKQLHSALSISEQEKTAMACQLSVLLAEAEDLEKAKTASLSESQSSLSSNSMTTTLSSSQSDS